MIGQFNFGQMDGTIVQGFELRNSNGLLAKLITYGARLTEFHAPDRNGANADIVLGFDRIEDYIATNTYFGATCGRYGNRIHDGRFELGGATVNVGKNEGQNHLHGGHIGFDRKIWQATVDEPNNAVTFTMVSNDGDEGFPGNVLLAVTYALSEDNHLKIHMRGITDKQTVLNTVHHTYWNLAGHSSGDVLKQVLHLNSNFYTPVDEELITTGEILKVADTVFDFRKPKPIGQDIHALSDVGTGDLVGGGYDHNWCLNGDGNMLHLCAEVRDPASGRCMELRTSEPGVQFYTGGYLDDKVIGKLGLPYCRFAGFTFETQKFPNAPNFSHFQSSALKSDVVYDHYMVFRFFSE